MLIRGSTISKLIMLRLILDYNFIGIGIIMWSSVDQVVLINRLIGGKGCFLSAYTKVREVMEYPIGSI